MWDASGKSLGNVTISDGVGDANGTFTATLSGVPAFVTFNSKAAGSLSITLDPATDGVAYTNGDMSGLPILAQSAVTQVGSSTTSYKFSLKHKLAYVDFTDLKVNGADMSNCTMDGLSTLTIDAKTGVGTAGSGTYTGKDVSTGKVYAVVPTTRFTVNADYKNFLNNKVYSAVKTAEGRYYAINKDAVINHKPYMQWDAVEGGYFVDGTQTGNQAYNPTMGVASRMCKDCPTYDEICAYLGQGVYWDDGTVGTATSGLQTYKLPYHSTLNPDNRDFHTGLWLKKKSASSWSSTATATGVTPTAITSGNASIRTSGDYFFLPAAGIYDGGSYDRAGTNGYYWSSTPLSSASYAYRLGFYIGRANVGSSHRSVGVPSWVAE